MPSKRSRPVRLDFWVTEQEKELIQEKMAQLGTVNMSAYLRKIAIDGYVVQLDLPELPELPELLSLLRRSSNNLNQLTRRVHETNRIYDADLESLRQEYDKLWDAAELVVKKLSALS